MAKEAVSAAKEILADDPKDFTALYYTMYFTQALAGANPQPDVLDQGEKAANAILANINTPPPNVTEEQWKTARTDVEILGHTDLGWIAMQRKNWTAAEAEFQKSLQISPNNSQVDYWMGTVLISQKKVLPALFYFARAAVYDGTGSLTPDGRKQGLDYVQNQYKNYHCSNDGFDDLLRLAKTQTAPPPDLNIKTCKDIADEDAKKAEEDAKKNPELTMWKSLKAALTGPDGANYFSTSMKDAVLPKLKGRVRSIQPRLQPKPIVRA